MRLFIFAIVTIACSACASGPVTERAPKDLRLSIRHLNRGTLFYNKGCFSKAVQLFQAAHERFTAADNLEGSAESLNSLANAYYRLKDMDSAVLVYDEAEALYRLLDDKVGRIRTLTNKSVALASSGKLEAAEQALNLADSLAENSDSLTGHRLKARAILKLQNQDFDGSRQLLARAIRAIPQTDTRQFASAQYTMGHLLLSIQQARKAQRHLKKALAADRKTGDYFSIGQDLEALGDCHAQLEQHAKAVSDYKRSLKIYAMLNNRNNAQQVSSKLAKSASKADADIQATLHWAAQWLAGQREADICR